ncbi:family 10 glycosylhydrolase, partial [Bacteroides ovatus]
MLNKNLILSILLLFTTYSFAGNINKEKPKYLWFDAEANFERFSSKDSISYYLEKAKDVGFNQVVVDVKPIYGEVLYKSKILPPLTTVHNKVIERDWDYLQYFIDEAHRLGLKVTVSTAVFTAGHPATCEGLVYEDKRWNGKTCLEYMSNNKMLDIRDDKQKVGAFLNPVRKDVRNFALSIIREIVKNYDIDAYALDYCRYPADNSDFSNETRKAFENYLGKKIKNFPEDIFSWNTDGSKRPGIYFKEWWAFRANVISSFVKEVRENIHSINKNVKLEY